LPIAAPLIRKIYQKSPPLFRGKSMKPHLTARFKVSNDPQFEEKVTDIVGV
jgi:hypothetical protein